MGSRPVRVIVVTVSDTRTPEDDVAGDKLSALLVTAGCEVTGRAIVRDEPSEIRTIIDRVCDQDLADAVITTGGTGIAPRDQTYEAVDTLLEKRLDGFGEAFRRLSWDEIGPRAILSRALAGTYRARVVACVPGSPKAMALAVEKILGPILPHATALARGEKHGH